MLDALLPPQCMLCTAPVDQPGHLCPTCWPGIAFIAAPLCPSCGTPYALPVPEGLVCGACLKEPPRYAQARAAFAYAGGGRDLVLRFKRGDRTDLAPGLARLMAAAGAGLLTECDAILPVPLHPRRLWQRRYNQAALLAGELGRLAGKPVLPDLLERPRPTRSLGRLGRAERRRILAGAIRVAGDRAGLPGRRLLLIDDVLTTGATADACCRALLRAGAARVDLLTLARVVRPEQGTI